jgi:hypothetical protein
MTSRPPDPSAEGRYLYQMSKCAPRARRAGLACVLFAPLLACGGEPGEETTLESSPAPDAGGEVAISSLHGDLIEPAAPASGKPESDETTVRSALSGGSPPKVFYLEYADGTKPPAVDYDACGGKTAPKFVCSFAPTLAECQRQIQTYLDKWYADFNIIFTLTRPKSGKYYTEVISSGGGAWCNVDAKVAGVAPFLCKDLQGGVAYAFSGGRTAHETAVIVAQEQAHLLGLEHTTSGADIMLPTICTDCDGFKNGDSPVTGDRCDRTTQNSYQMMMNVLGPWGGGPKPSPFGCMSDNAPPTVTFLSPAAGKIKNNDFSVKVDVRDDCDVSKVAITVTPEGLTAEAKAPPYEWDLTGISGDQTITVVATDHFGKIGMATLKVSAPTDLAYQDPPVSDTGCTVAAGAFGATGILPSLAMLFVFSGHHRRSRKRVVTGALAFWLRRDRRGGGGTTRA